MILCNRMHHPAVLCVTVCIKFLISVVPLWQAHRQVLLPTHFPKVSLRIPIDIEVNGHASLSNLSLPLAGRPHRHTFINPQAVRYCDI